MTTYTDDKKCEKIVIHVYRSTPSGQESQMNAITDFVTTGRIQAQGIHCMDWAKDEFPVLLASVNAQQESPHVDH